MLSTNQKGAIAETAIALEALKAGVEVYRPAFEGGRYDLILAHDHRLLRVQCKWARRKADVVMIGCYSCRRTRSGLATRAYTSAEVDVIAAYCLDTEACYLVPPEVFEATPRIQLRLARAKNGQRRRINWADEFDFAARLREHFPGAIAQLGERQSGTLEVAGSSPAGSIESA